MIPDPFIIWSDISAPVEVDAQGSIKTALNADAVKVSIGNILRTKITERVMLPDFGSRLTGMVFELADEQLFNTFEDEIVRAIIKWDNRVSINSIDFKLDPDRNSVELTVFFGIIGYDEIFEATTII